MKNTPKDGSSPKSDQKPLVENEAIKNTEDIKDEKKSGKETADEEEFPGYPHYPPGEDLLSHLNRVDIDVEKITRAGNIVGPDLASARVNPPAYDLEQPITDDIGEEEDIDIVPGTEADVTKDDLIMLGDKDQDMDMGEDEELQNKGFRLSLTGDDLDVPGGDLDDANEDIGEEDEENNYYSLGGDEKESLEEDSPRDVD